LFERIFDDARVDRFSAVLASKLDGISHGRIQIVRCGKLREAF
jgi:hypothetical protein